jgi:integrase
LKVSLWQAYVAERLGAGIKPITLNGELSAIHSLMRFHQELGRAVNAGLLYVPRLRQKQRRLDNVSIDLLRDLLAEMDRDIERNQAKLHHMALMDKSATLLMLHCGMRSGEVRHLKLRQIDWQWRKVRIEQSKGLKDRMVYMSQAVIEALKAYLEVRGTHRTFPDEVFIYRSKPLSPGYLYGRLRGYGERFGAQITPHQLRHSSATLLSQAGATSASVQAILGHRWMSTTMRYMRLQKPMMAAAYYAAMVFIEKRIRLLEDDNATPPSPGQLLALVDYLQMSALDKRQAEIVAALQDGLLSIATEGERQSEGEYQKSLDIENRGEWNREFY